MCLISQMNDNEAYKPLISNETIFDIERSR